VFRGFQSFIRPYFQRSKSGGCKWQVLAISYGDGSNLELRRAAIKHTDPPACCQSSIHLVAEKGSHAITIAQTKEEEIHLLTAIRPQGQSTE
jgi:hypothetical protein